ncbi:MAG: UDP-N-acetylmuramate--L-alanine ligase [Clostridia bacterium]|nr:UDP-N-acetylmuramate--L-alanine ligase [Clostridia bacterium]NLS84068.1 UDP-N-acetylmuramate--L-alanine ligase [Oscillospiraceae bacterium]
MNGFDSTLLDGVTSIHFIGIGGSGMFPLVQILHEVGYEITGSDVNEGDIIDRERKLGIKVTLEHKAENVHGAQLVVYTAAIMNGNPEVEEAKKLGIPCVERSIMLGYVTNTYPHPICVSGTHGKTTTTSMIAQTVLMAGKDCSAIIGGKLPYIDSYGKYGAGREIIVEACEYHNTFLQLVPYISVLLNIDADHLEFFKTMDNLKESFRRFCLLTQNTIIANIDDKNTVQVIGDIDRHVCTFGIKSPADYRAVNVKEYRPSFFAFDVEVMGHKKAYIELNVPGEHNVYNAVAAFAAASLVGCTPEECKAGLEAFKGAGRRFEFLGEVNGVTIADDYAHHPAELEATLTAAKEMQYKHVWAVHQPFTYSRTQMLMDDFARVLQIADNVVLTEIMGSRERAEDYTVRTKDLAAKIPDSVWYNTFDEVVEHVMQNAEEGDLVITLGCGDIYKAAKKMLHFKK